MNYTIRFEVDKVYYEEDLRNVPDSVIRQHFDVSKKLETAAIGYVTRAVCKKSFLLSVSAVETL